MKKIDVVRALLGDRYHAPPAKSKAWAFAPSNIALCKYWGKRDAELNLPMTASLSIFLGHKGTALSLSLSKSPYHQIILNGQAIQAKSSFANRLNEFLLLFCPPNVYFHFDIQSNVPIAAGLASSACGFASIVLACDALFNWQLNPRELSILARLGSGSACRSILGGFVEWHAGVQADGMDSFGEKMNTTWPELCVGLLLLNAQEKNISSRVAMQRTKETSLLYAMWPDQVNRDLALLKTAIHTHNFPLLGQTAESNALAMHATSLAAWPPIQYSRPETLAAQAAVWNLRESGTEIYFTQDAGPNLKLLFLRASVPLVQHYFKTIEIVQPFVNRMNRDIIHA